MRKRNTYVQAVLVMILGLLLMSPGMAQASSPVPPDKQEDWMYHTIVDFDFVKEHIIVPREDSVFIVDSRPYKPKFIEGYIPTAHSIPDSQFEEMVDKLPKDKNALLIFYCGGFECKLSHNSAKKAEALGYKNVKVYAAGYPDFKKYYPYCAVEMDYVKQQIADNTNYLLVDSRPLNKYLEGNVPSSVSISDTKFEEKTGLLPTDKSIQLIFYCGGHECKLSHKSAVKASELGYTNIMVAEEGYPAWKQKFGAGGQVTIDTGGVDGAIPVEQFEKYLTEQPDAIHIIDVRDKDEFDKGHFPGSTHMTVDELNKSMDKLPSDKPVVFVCSSGARSGEAFYMVMDKQPERKDVYYLDAACSFDGEKYEIKKPQ